MKKEFQAVKESFLRAIGAARAPEGWNRLVAAVDAYNHAPEEKQTSTAIARVLKLVDEFSAQLRAKKAVSIDFAPTLAALTALSQVISAEQQRIEPSSKAAVKSAALSDPENAVSGRQFLNGECQEGVTGTRVPFAPRSK